MEIEDSVLDQSRQCSTVCRQIVFALGGLAWAFIYGNKDNHVFYPVLTLIFVVLYMAVDICQYLYYYLATRPLVMQLNKAYFHPDYTKTERERMRKDCEIKKIKIQNMAHRIFLLKVTLLPIIIITIGYYILSMVL